MASSRYELLVICVLSFFFALSHSKTLKGDVQDLSIHGSLYAVSIVGPFPIAVTNLLDLTRLDIHNNKLTGPMPSQIGRLKRLNLRWNKLQDVIPPEVGELKRLTHLYLSVLQQVHSKHSFCAIAHIPKLTFPVSILITTNLLGESQTHSTSILSSKKCTLKTTGLLSPKERFSSLSLCCFVCVYFPNNQTYFSSFINFVSQTKEKTSLPWFSFLEQQSKGIIL
ncbi:hypothetical protein Bca4012_053011 [Brassica carinata]